MTVSPHARGGSTVQFVDEGVRFTVVPLRASRGRLQTFYTPGLALRLCPIIVTACCRTQDGQNHEE
jgi:hypothetical protein